MEQRGRHKKDYTITLIDSLFIKYKGNKYKQAKHEKKSLGEEKCVIREGSGKLLQEGKWEIRGMKGEQNFTYNGSKAAIDIKRLSKKKISIILKN